mmetsp:Transcript_26406/g.82326  ORF Transcript_26406/g.82326 Transcript_26406/m.82326 type:complete len:207 (-) Transcript_26406:147-767(-)
MAARNAPSAARTAAASSPSWARAPAQRRPQLVQALHGVRRGLEALEVEVERAAVLARDDEEPEAAQRRGVLADVAERPEIAQRLAHLLAVDVHEAVVHPAVAERRAVRRLGLGDLVLVVREDEVDAAGVEVQRRPEVALRHRRALDVPARAAGAPRRVPGDLAVRILARLPEREVLRRALLARRAAVADATTLAGAVLNGFHFEAG